MKQKQRIRIILVTILVIVLLGIGIIVWLLAEAGDDVATDDPVVIASPPTVGTIESAANGETEETETEVPEYNAFPEIPGTSLAGMDITDIRDLGNFSIRVPTELNEGPLLLVVAYDANQQNMVNDWFAPLLELNETYPTLSGYYVPILPKDTADSAGLIISGFLFTASDDERDRTIVVFTDVERFNVLVGVENTTTIQLFLLDESYHILWHGSGAYTSDKLSRLQAQLDAFNE